MAKGKDYKYKKYYKNPRNLTKQQGSDLRRWLREFGDLSGIVHEENSDEVISGNQRSEIINLAECEIEISIDYDEATPQGTVAQGYVNWQGERFTYRRVNWTKEKCEQANIIANKSGGTWDFEELANGFEMGNLLEWGFEAWEFGYKDEGLSDEQMDEFFEEDTKEKTPVFKVVLEYSESDCELVTNALKKIQGSKEDIVFKLLGL
jgi:hypothetical protein